MARLWKWATAKASRTWVAHGLVSLCGSTAGATVGNALVAARPLSGFVVVGAVILVYFVIREFMDKRKYMKAGTWNTSDPKWRDGVPPAADMAGDLMGPTFVFLTAIAVYILTS